MTVVALTFTSSDEEITSGIPRYVDISSNVPSTIYYTIDGSTPTEESLIYVETLQLSDGQTSITLSAFGVDYDGYLSPILTQTFAADQTDITISRNIGSEGLVVDRYDDLTDYVVGYDYMGEAVAYSDIERIDLSEIHSSSGRLGLAEGTLIEISKPNPEDTANPFDDEFQANSSPSDLFFNPYAKTITVDKREDNTVTILSRPFGSIRTNANRHNIWERQELRGAESTHVSGGHIRTFYNSKNNIMMGFYYDNYTNRWIRSIQDMPSNITNSFNFWQFGQPLVFRWIGRGRHSIIPI